MPYWQHAALAGAVFLIIVVVALFQRFNVRHGWHRRLTLFLAEAFGPQVGEEAGNIILQLAFVGLVALAAHGLQFVGVALPPELEQFVPSTMTAILGAIVASVSYRFARRRPSPEPADPG